MKLGDLEREQQQLLQARYLLIACTDKCGRYQVLDQAAGDRPGAWVSEQEAEYLALGGDSQPWDEKYFPDTDRETRCPECLKAKFGHALDDAPVLRRLFSQKR